MPSVRIEIKPFLQSGEYAPDWTDVTKYVVKTGQIEVDADSLDYQLGVFRNSNVSLTFTNRSGRFSDVDNPESMFRFKRNDSQIRVLWAPWEYRPVAGFTPVPFVFGSEVVIFDGLLSDDATKENAKTEEVPFTALGLEALFARVEVPSSVLAGDTPKDLILATLNQAPVTDLLIIDELNIDPAMDQALDDVGFAENMSGKELLDAVLLYTNSVCFIRDRIVYVTSKDPTPDLVKTFYGQASKLGAEDIVDAKGISSGLNRTFNTFFWDGSASKQKDNDSIARYGVRKKSLSFDGYTDLTKQNTIASALLADFKDSKKELEIVTPATSETIALKLFDRVNVDYPTVFVPEPGTELPICGLAICGEATLPRGLWALTLQTYEHFKIINKKVEVSSHLVTFKLRGV